MNKITDSETVLNWFEQATIKHAECTETGNYKECNKAFDKAMKAIDYLKKKNDLLKLKCFLEHPSAGPKLWSATYLLPIIEEKSIDVLTTMIERFDIHGGLARDTISEWKNGNLREYLTRPPKD